PPLARSPGPRHHQARAGSQLHRIFATRWLIWLAWCAGPKPLSMLTTDTPGAHELSIARSPAMPPKDAPYPTLVGPAITGRSTSPSITLRRAPSMPATTTLAFAA